jgi:hypothetical protein
LAVGYALATVGFLLWIMEPTETLTRPRSMTAEEERAWRAVLRVEDRRHRALALGILIVGIGLAVIARYGLGARSVDDALSPRLVLVFLGIGVLWYGGLLVWRLRRSRR